MLRSVCVHLLPVMFSPEDLRGKVAVVIDVLRASTTITQALFTEAKSVIPCGDVSAAHQTAVNLSAGSYLLGGECGGVKIEGFDLGNSPREYTADEVAGRTIVFTTADGTKALKRCELADKIVIGSFANLDAVSKAAGKTLKPVHLVCAGTDGVISAEDVLCAGAMVEDLQIMLGHRIVREDDAARLAWEFYVGHSQTEDALLEAIRSSAGGRNLVQLGYDADIAWSAKRNRFQLVPEYDPKSGRIESSDV